MAHGVLWYIIDGELGPLNGRVARDDFDGRMDWNAAAATQHVLAGYMSCPYPLSACTDAWSLDFSTAIGISLHHVNLCSICLLATHYTFTWTGILAKVITMFIIVPATMPFAHHSRG